MTYDPTPLVEAAKKATQGEWRRQTLGGASTVLTAQKPQRNGVVPPFGWQEGGEHCLAYPVIEDERRCARLDYVNFSHEDSAYIVAAQPRNILALVDSFQRDAAAKDAEIARLRRIEHAANNVTMNSNRGNDGVSAVPGCLIDDLRATLREPRA